MIPVNLEHSWVTWCPPLILFGWLLSLAVRGRLSGRRFAPGPRPLPLVGNLFDIPQDFAWVKFLEWKKTFGDVIHVNALGQNLVILNSLEAINDLLDRRRPLYSDRPVLHMAGTLMGAGNTMSFSQPNERWKMYRKFTRQALNKQAVKQFHPLQTNAALLYLQSLLREPHDFVPQLRFAVGRIILSTMYGFCPVSAEDEYVTLIEYCLNEVSHAAVPGAYLVDLIPILKYVPTWFPGASFRRIGEHVRKETIKMIDMPFFQVKDEVKLGTATPSFVANLLQSMESTPEIDYNIKWAAGTMYAAGMDTTYATVLTFMSLMLLYPSVQARAQQEIDQVLSGERLPNFDDLASLPYCDALIKEINRFRPPVRLGIPHASNQADEYKGYFIPKNSTVIPNIWAISRDPSLYEDPERFWPERFLNKDKHALDPNSYIFGFGSRSCPGIHLATESLTILIVSILAGFNVLPTQDEHGDDVIPDVQYTPTLTCVPLAFPCRFEPRPKYGDIIADAQAEATNTREQRTTTTI